MENSILEFIDFKKIIYLKVVQNITVSCCYCRSWRGYFVAISMEKITERFLP
jgi:hypothetical protein